MKEIFYVEWKRFIPYEGILVQGYSYGLDKFSLIGVCARIEQQRQSEPFPMEASEVIPAVVEDKFYELIKLYKGYFENHTPAHPAGFIGACPHLDILQ